MRIYPLISVNGQLYKTVKVEDSFKAVKAGDNDVMTGVKIVVVEDMKDAINRQLLIDFVHGE